MTPTQRTLKALRERGNIVWIVEKWNSFTGRRTDMFNIIDIVALDHGYSTITNECYRKGGVIGVQSCGTAFSEHLKKLTIEKAEDTRNWLLTPGTSLELWGWRKVKVKRGGKAMKYEPRVQVITLDDLKF